MTCRILTLVVLVSIHCGVRRADAGLVYYSNQAAFDAAAPRGPTQTFAFLDGTLGPNLANGLPTPIDAATSNQYVSPGDILPGLRISTNPVRGDVDVLVAGSGTFGNANPLVGANYYRASLELGFGPSVPAVGLGLLSLLEGGDLTLSFYSPSGAMLGQTTVNGVPNSGVGQFFGATTTDGDTIGSISILSNSGQVVALDRVQFGQSEVVPNPEPASVVLLGTAVASLGGYLGWKRRREVTA